jgi:hypothetical protein
MGAVVETKARHLPPFMAIEQQPLPVSPARAVLAHEPHTSLVDRRYLEDSNISWKGELVYGPSLRRCTLLTVIILCAVVWWASADAVAQEAPPTGLSIAAPTTLWSRESLRSDQAPYLVIGMADRGGTTGSFWLARDKGTNPSAGNTITRQVGPAASANRTEKAESGPLVLSSLVEPTVGFQGYTDFRAEPTSPRVPNQGPPNPADAKVYSLLDDRLPAGFFVYGSRANYLPSIPWLADNESLAHEVGPASSPLFQLELGGWQLPVVLSDAAVAR